jgi:hypothetical protein
MLQLNKFTLILTKKLRNFLRSLLRGEREREREEREREEREKEKIEEKDKKR